MHDGESVGITERCNESEPVAQGGDEMIHPVGFASKRIIDLNLSCECKKASCEATSQLAPDGRGRRNRSGMIRFINLLQLIKKAEDTRIDNKSEPSALSGFSYLFTPITVK